jgi:hypothetical protein
MGSGIRLISSDPKTPEFAGWVSYGEWDAKALGIHLHTAYTGATIELAASDRADVLWEIRVDGKPTEPFAGSRSTHPSGRRLPMASSSRLAFSPRRWSPARRVGASEVRITEAGRTRYRELPTTPASEFDLACRSRKPCEPSRSRRSCVGCPAASSNA